MSYLSAREAAERLGVSLPTLYAYVSRGLLSSEPLAAGDRRRRYRREEVEALLARREARRDPSKAVAAALDWGGPVLESAITLIDHGRLFYRGHDALDLARERSLEEVAELIWEGRPAVVDPGELAAAEPGERYRRALGDDPLEPFERLRLLLPCAALDDLASHDLRPAAVARCGRRLLRTMAAAAAGLGGGTIAGRTVAELLAAAWCPGEPAAARLLDAALVLCADHELNVSAFTARCVASAAATPYDVVGAGLAALSGGRHGGLSARTEALLGQLWAETGGETGELCRALARRLRRGEGLPGFGHHLYPEGDPRARLLLELLDRRLPGSRRAAWARHLAAEAGELLGERPTIDLGLGALSLALSLPAGAALATFALGRTVGWIGQALEQLAAGKLIRPRARYVGPAPAPSTEAGGPTGSASEAAG